MLNTDKGQMLYDQIFEQIDSIAASESICQGVSQFFTNPTANGDDNFYTEYAENPIKAFKNYEIRSLFTKVKKYVNNKFKRLLE